MQTMFSDLQLQDPANRESEKILRNCVHCGFCTATCPTYVLLGDELDSPRGRIYLMKQMLESGKPPSAETVKHIDRCLSCLACMTTCPSGVNYMHLVDHGRAYIERHYRRPWQERLLRLLLARIIPHPSVFRLSMMGAAMARRLDPYLPAKMRSMLALVPRSLPKATNVDRPQTFPAIGSKRVRVALLTGCAQRVLAPEINEATVRLLTRLGAEVVVAPGMGCCGALTHHMGKERSAQAFAKANIDAWTALLADGGLDAVAINASGCGTMVKDYGHMLRNDAAYAEKAARIAALARDITELVAGLGLPPATNETDLVVAYHSACSMQHGQQITSLPKQLLSQVGFTVRDVPEGHLCCGSAGTYNLLQPEIAVQLRDRKIANILSTGPDAVATGNIGCITQLASAIDVPVLHTVELLDWATGGPAPAGWQSPSVPGRPGSTGGTTAA